MFHGVRDFNMRYLILAYIFFFDVMTASARPGAFLFLMPKKTVAPFVQLEWTPPNWDVPSLANDTFVFTLQNTGTAISDTLNISFSFGATFSLVSETCSFGILLPGGSCTATIDYNGINDATMYLLSADDGHVFNLIDAQMHYCPGC